MTAPILVDHSPHHPSPAAPIPTASNLVLIDNYDSFTWNVYQYLVLEGASVTVYRNDEISLEELIAKNPTQLVVSPGPGHPKTDSGFSCDAIKFFGGKIPVLGVCMGEQCIFAAYGGLVDVTGEILHGKTSPLSHDGKGIYAGLPQDLPVTRYHSLAGTHASLPKSLEVSSWIAKGPDGGKGIIMGVRHKELLVEGVQFHPESILTAEGRSMLKNFLHMKGGTWSENEKHKQQGAENGISSNGRGKKEDTTGSPEDKESILEKIYRHRRAEVEKQKLVPSQRLSDLQAALDLDLAPPQISFPKRLRSSPYSLSLLAEIKRASPSKGAISMDVCAPAQASKYALAGASVISVLTEPEWFKGSIEDLRAVRRSLEGMPNRPAVLRKEFIFDEYQILEARLAGADTVLLIVKMLDEQLLTKLYRYSQELGMEPLVEVNTTEEMQIALKLNAQVIGVNNRNLTNFEVDLDTTSRLMKDIPKSTMICALSGISGPEDVQAYRQHGVSGILVGEALMRSPDVAAYVSHLLGDTDKNATERVHSAPLVKICGTRTPEAAEFAVAHGADMIGMILVEGRKRYVSDESALAISNVVHSSQRPKKDQQQNNDSNSTKTSNSTITTTTTPISFFDHSALHLLRHPTRALLVGVFQNQPLATVLAKQRLLKLDVVQLHGSESLEWCRQIPVPVIRRFGPGDAGLGSTGYHALPLIDSAVGGSGEGVGDGGVGLLRRGLERDPGLRVMLAGGLTAENVVQAVERVQGGRGKGNGKGKGQVVGVDVSSGVEVNGVQSVERIAAFIKAAKGV